MVLAIVILQINSLQDTQVRERVKCRQIKQTLEQMQKQVAIFTGHSKFQDLTLPVLFPCLSVAERMMSVANGSPNLIRVSSHEHFRMLGTSA